MTDIENRLRTAIDGNATVPPRLKEELRKRAMNGGLVDIAYATIESPLGPLLAATTKRGLLRLSYQDENVDAALERLALNVSPRIVESPKSLDGVRRELDEYFAGRRKSFELAIDWSFASGFVRRVLKATARVPFGNVSSYAQIAAQAGSPRASRAAGNALGANPVPIVVPCHRVIHSGGGLGGYGGGLERKRELLRLEGVAV